MSLKKSPSKSCINYLCIQKKSMKTTREPGRYTISVGKGWTENPDFALVYGSFDNHQVEMSLQLPQQVIRLRSVKVIVSSDVSALKHRDIWIELPFVSYNHSVDNSSNRTSFSFPLSGAITYENALDKPLYMSKDALRKYPITIRNAYGQIIEDMNSIYLDFETELGSLGTGA